MSSSSRVSASRDSAPSDRQAIFDLHPNATSTDLAVGDPRRVIEGPGLFDDQVIFIRKLSMFVVVADVIVPSKAFLGSSRRQALAAVDVLVCPPGVSVPGTSPLVYRTKPIFNAGWPSEARATDALPSPH